MSITEELNNPIVFTNKDFAAISAVCEIGLLHIRDRLNANKDRQDTMSDKERQLFNQIAQMASDCIDALQKMDAFEAALQAAQDRDSVCH